ncbi:hypothetical protein FA95DRAFT_1506859 [Auriscalpium vulgare]|uniref:Uncharacterized protein n=1 Tax=Auriscalpium vulgare TaxID=40419 RepID=A0ACB8R103_9AGAM|nr:hypothetical protein FA95DRAFT_1506859 [Auriscalpium vulgare]
MSLEARLQAASNEYQELQAELSKTVEVRQRLDAQLSENELVKKEFASLTPNNTVYKMVGPVLVKQEQQEAKSNVDTRLDFIRSEITRIEANLKDIGEKSEKKKGEVRVRDYLTDAKILKPYIDCRDANDAAVAATVSSRSCVVASECIQGLCGDLPMAEHIALHQFMPEAV